ncbi:uncharacterized protein J3R85_006063 [Psidium guajava]|nr:uncharacterized protein J3R85_006063 [Psidium guajava]
MDSQAMRPCRLAAMAARFELERPWPRVEMSSSSSHGRLGILAGSRPWPPSVELAAARPWPANPKLELERLERPWLLQARGRS